MSVSLFLDLCRAENARQVKDALDSHAEELGRASHLDLQYQFVGGRPNNRGQIGAMSSMRAALYEKIMNGFDSLIDHYQRNALFKSDPSNAAMALSEIAENNERGVYMITTKANTALGQLGQPPKRQNVLILDEGTGILPEAFPATILSLNGNNKTSNPLMAGTYGMGGSAIYNKTDYCLIYSIPEERPDEVAFTVVYERYVPAERDWPAYVYVLDDDGRIPTISISELPSELVLYPEELNSRNAIYAGSKVLLPRVSGTGVKVFELEGLASNPEVQDYLKDRGFGMPVPVQFRNGVPVTPTKEDPEGLGAPQSGGLRRVNDVKGQRFAFDSLNNPVIHHVRDVPVLVENGQSQARLEMWVLERGEKNISEKGRKRSPVASVLGDSRADTPIYITINGMTQHNMPSYKLLQKAGLNFVSGNVIIEINCDVMDRSVRGKFFTSTRERIDDRWEQRIKDEIIKFLKTEAGSRLGEINREMQTKLLEQATGEVGTSGLAQFARIMKMAVAGSILGQFGFRANLPTTQKVKLTIGYDHGRGGGAPNRLGPRRIPQEVEVRKATIKQGETQWIVIRTDAYDDWDEAISITLPPFLAVVPNGRLPLQNGVVRISVECDAAVKIGTTATITATLDRSRINQPPLIADADILVIKQSSNTKEQEADESVNKPQKSMPDIQLVGLEPHGEGWDQMRTGGIPAEQVAFHWTEVAAEGKVYLFYNKKFPALQYAVEELGRKKANQRLLDTLHDDYLLHLRLMVVSEMNTKHDITSEQTVQLLHRARADSVRATTLMLTLKAEQFGALGGAAQGEGELAEAA
jgi:hypothetical protein